MSKSKSAAGDRRPTVQVVEDEPDLVLMYRVSLEAAGFHVVRVAGDGLVALNQLRRCRPDVILTGILMPYLDGWGLIERLRPDPPASDRIPVVVASASLSAARTARCLAMGADRTLAKPFDLGELIAVLADLAGAAPRPDLDTPAPEEPYRPDPARFVDRVDRVAQEVTQLAEQLCACATVAEMADLLGRVGPLVGFAGTLAQRIHADAEDDGVVVAIHPLRSLARLGELGSVAASLAERQDQWAVLEHVSFDARHWLFKVESLELGFRPRLVLEVQDRALRLLSADLRNLADALTDGSWDISHTARP